MNYWLFKSEPNTYSIEDLQKEKVCYWEGIRNYQARNYLRDRVKKNDLVLFYHSNISDPAIVGLAKVVKEAYPDFTALDPQSIYYDPKASKENPRWFLVDLQFEKKFKKKILRSQLKKLTSLKNMVLFTHSRLSIQPVEKKQFDILTNLAES